MANTQKLDSFISAVLSDAREKRRQILDELQAQRNAELQKAENEILNDAYRYMHDELARIKKIGSHELSKINLEYRRELLKLRSEIVEGVFFEVTEKLEKFTLTGDYFAFLTENAKKAAQIIKEKPAVLMLRAKDMQYASELLKHFEKGSTAVEDENIVLGGFRVKCVEIGVFIDETLDTRLAEEKVKFEENSGLYTD